MSDSTTKKRRYRTLEDRTLALEQKVLRNKSRLALKDLSRQEGGQKTLRAIRALAVVSGLHEVCDEALVKAAQNALDGLARAVSKRYGIMLDHLIDLEAEEETPPLPFDDKSMDPL